jgi:hypothetical protein
MEANNASNASTDKKATTVYADKDLVLDALRGAMAEHEGNAHILRIVDDDGLLGLEYDVVRKTFDMTEGVDYVRPQTITDNDCEDGWETRVEFKNEVDLGRASFDIDATRTLDIQYSLY